MQNFLGNLKKKYFLVLRMPSIYVNNEISGSVLLNSIMKYIKSKYPKKRFSYRFVLLPETIGSIAYLSKLNLL